MVQAKQTLLETIKTKSDEWSSGLLGEDSCLQQVDDAVPFEDLMLTLFRSLILSQTIFTTYRVA